MNIYESWLVKQPIAHRGLFGDKIPENSIAAFKNAIKNKLPIELDVTCLADGTPVVFHDEKLARMTGKDGFISNCKYEDIQKLTLAGTKERIPTLQEALDLIDGKVPILVEIKNYGKVVGRRDGREDKGCVVFGKRNCSSEIRYWNKAQFAIAICFCN